MRLRARIKHGRIYTRNKWTLNIQATPLEDCQHRTRPPHWEPTTIERTPHTMGAWSLPHRLCHKPAHKMSAKKTYDHPACPPCNGRFQPTSPVVSQNGAQSFSKEDLQASNVSPMQPALSAKKTYDHPAWPPRNGLASSLHQRFVAGGLFRANSCQHVSVYRQQRTVVLACVLNIRHPTLSM
jgi:hypothetical protein